MNIYHAVAPKDFARRKTPGMSAWFRFVKEELMRNFRPFLRKVSAALITPSKAPGHWRKSSWMAAVLPSRDRETMRMPDSSIRRQTSSSTRAPLVAMHMRSPIAVPKVANSKISSLRRGSPPDRTTTGEAKPAISERSRFPSSVEKSPSNEVSSDEQRQWTHRRLHLRVTSQASHFRVNSVFMPAPALCR